MKLPLWKHSRLLTGGDRDLWQSSTRRPAAFWPCRKMGRNGIGRCRDDSNQPPCPDLIPKRWVESRLAFLDWVTFSLTHHPKKVARNCRPGDLVRDLFGMMSSRDHDPIQGLSDLQLGDEKARNWITCQVWKTSVLSPILLFWSQETGADDHVLNPQVPQMPPLP